jgi:hypothetical protein
MIEIPTVAAIHEAYARLKDWTEVVMLDRQKLTFAQSRLKEVEAQLYPDAKNDAERKAARMTATVELRADVQGLEDTLARSEYELTAARLSLDEQHDIMRLAEYLQSAK